MSISTNIERQEVIQGEKYTHSGVIVTATYQDKTTKDVTSESTFSSVDTSVIGYHECIVSYKDKSVKIIVDVVANSVRSLDVDVTNAKKIYKVSERLSVANIKVKAIYRDGSSKDITDFSYEIYDDTNHKVFEDYVIASAGIYTVEIKYSGFKETYEIVAYNDQNKYASFKADNIINDYTLQNNSCTLYNEVDINGYIKIQRGSKLIKGEIKTYQSTAYMSFVRFSYNGGIKLHVVEDSILILMASSNDSSKLLVTNTTRSSNTIDLTQEFDVHAIMLERGEYSISTNGEADIYDVVLASVNSSSPNASLTNLVINTQNMNLSYTVGDTFNTTGLEVIAYFSDGTTQDVKNSCVISNPDMSTAGIKTITVTYGNFSKTFTINVVAAQETKTITFGYSGATYQEWTETIVIDENFDPANYIRTPDSTYFFIGFSHDLKTVKDGDFVKVYVKKIESNKNILAYITESYQYITFQTYTAGQVVDFSEAYEFLYTELKEKFVKWDYNQTIVTRNSYAKAIFADNVLEGELSIVVLSSQSATISIPDYTNLSYVNIDITQGNNVNNCNDLPIELTNLSPTATYTVSGYYVTYDGQSYTKYTCSGVIDTSGFASVSQVNSDDYVQMYENGVTISTEGYANAAPEGYALAGFELSEVDGNNVEFTPYNDAETVGFTGLVAGREYDVIVCYDKVDTRLSRVKKAPNPTPGYRFKFVGFRVIGDRHGNLCTVRMMHDSDLLYTYYVESGSSLDFPYVFALPIKYENERIIGSYQSLQNITSDLDVEVLFLEHQTGKHTVVFYDYYQTIVSVQYITPGDSATAPNFIQMFDEGRYRYTFSQLNANITNVTGDLFVRPQYKTELIPSQPFYVYDLFIQDNQLYVHATGEYTKYITSYKDYVVGPSSTIEFTKSVNTKIDDYYKGLTSETTYKFYNEIEYDLLDGNGVQTVTTEIIEFTTLKLNEEMNSLYEIKQNSYYRYEYNIVKVSGDSATFYGTKDGVRTTSSYISINILGYTAGTKLVLNYCSNGFNGKRATARYMYYNTLEFTTPDYGMPVIEQIKIIAEEHSIKYEFIGQNLEYLDIESCKFEGISVQYEEYQVDGQYVDIYYDHLFEKTDYDNGKVYAILYFDYTYYPGTDTKEYYQVHSSIIDFICMEYLYQGQFIQIRLWKDYTFIH